MRWTFWLSIGLLALALSACGPALLLSPAGAEGDATPFDYAHDKQVLASPTATEGPTPAAEASATPSPSAVPTTSPTLLPEEPPPGTGLGETFLTWDGTRYRPHASEGGHADFAPTNPFEVELLRYLQDRFKYISYERVCSGRGLPNIRSRRAPTSRTAAMLPNRPG